MKAWSFVQVRRIAAYVLGALCIAFGLSGLVSDHVMPMGKDAMVCSGDTFSVVVMLWGGILCLITRFHYASGIWTVLGSILVGVAMILASIMVDAYAESHTLLLNGFGVAGFVFVLGCYCLVAGHIRQQRKLHGRPSNPQGGANGRQPFRSEALSTSGAAVSRPSP